MPHDWLFEVERIIISIVPAYTLEMLDNSDVDRLLPFYFYDYRKALRAKDNIQNTKPEEENIVIRNGKKYRKVKVDKAEWANSIF